MTSPAREAGLFHCRHSPVSYGGSTAFHIGYGTLLRGEAVVTDPINSIDTSSLSEADRVEIEKLRTAYDRAGPKAVAEGMSRLAKSHPDLFKWLIKNLTD